MKNFNLICALLFAAVLASCKKDNPSQNTPTQPSVPKIAAVTDSVSFTMDGKSYSAGGNNNLGAGFSNYGGQDANRKLIFPDPNNKSTWSLVGNPDSVIFYQKSTIANNTYDTAIQIYFAKKYHLAKGGLNLDARAKRCA